MSFAPAAESFRSTYTAELISLRTIEPPYRNVEHPKDHLGFSQPRMISVLRGIVGNEQIEPVRLLKLPAEGFAEPYLYRVRDGYHRVYGSIALGYRLLPANVIR